MAVDSYAKAANIQSGKILSPIVAPLSHATMRFPISPHYESVSSLGFLWCIEYRRGAKRRRAWVSTTSEMKSVLSASAIRHKEQYPTKLAMNSQSTPHGP